MTRTADINLPYRIYSNPVLWRPRASDPPMIALVAGVGERNRGTTTSVEVMQSNGRRVSGFPALKRNPPLVAPANQIVAGDIDGDGSAELIAIDFEGKPQAFKANGSAVAGARVDGPVHGLLVWPPTRMNFGDGSGTSLLLVSRDAQPGAESKHAVDLIAATGRSHPGFPVGLPSAAEQRRPIVDADAGRVFVLLENGRVDAMQLADGARPKGFPAGQDAPDVVAGTRHMTLLRAAKALFVSSGGLSLTRVDAASGTATQLMVAGAERLTGLDSAGERLYAFDEGTQRVVALDAAGKVQATLQLKLPPGSKCYSLVAVPAGKSGAVALLLVTSPDPDPAAKVGPLFEQHAPQDVRQKIRELADAEAMRRFGTLKLSAPQRKEIDASVNRMQRSWLQSRLGSGVLPGLLSSEALTMVQGLVDSGGQLQVALEDPVRGYTPETGFLLSRAVFPTATTDPAAGLLWVVPLNIAERETDPAANNRSLIRIYQMPF